MGLDKMILKFTQRDKSVKIEEGTTEGQFPLSVKSQLQAIAIKTMRC